MAIVLAIGAGIAGLAPFSGVTGFLKNLLICVFALCLLMFFGALFGSILRDFLLEAN